jgi:hypothetical protein
MYSKTALEDICSFFRKWGVTIFFTALLLLGLMIFRDYGMYWDDPAEHAHGQQVYNYIFHNDQSIFSSISQYHGPLFEFISVTLEKFFRITDTRDVYQFRHLLVFLTFYSGVFLFYRLCRNIFSSKAWALMACLFLVLSPKIFGHAFYNTKDIPAMAACIASFFTLVNYLDEKSLLRLFWHALACAAFVAIRLNGIFIVPLTIIAMVCTYGAQDGTKIKRHIGIDFCLYPLVFLVFLSCMWPILLSGPIYHLIMAFKELSHEPWYGTVLYCGSYWRMNLPWHYVPLWILISTPLVYVFYLIIGLFYGSSTLYDKRTLSRDKRNIAIIFVWFFLPIAAVILLHSHVFDSWRHMYFIYPALIVLAVFGMRSAFTSTFRADRTVAVAIVVVTIVVLLPEAWFMVRNHPFEDIYFNRLAGRNMPEIAKRFELDYWGLSYRKGLEYLLAIDTRPEIKIYFANLAGERTLLILPDALRRRALAVKNPKTADYYVTNFREYKEFYPYHGFEYPKNKIYSIDVDGAEIMAVYRL